MTRKRHAGERFTRLVLIKPVGKPPKLGNKWLCQCDCGNTTIVSPLNLSGGNTKSCGCYKREVSGKYRRKTDTKLRAIARYYRRNALTRGLIWNLEQDYFESVISLACNYCGTGPALGMDRVDNAVGYEVSNVVPCCSHCNRAKLAMSRSDFLAWIKRVYNHQLDKEVQSYEANIRHI